MDAVRNLGAGGRDGSGGHVGEQAMSGGEVVPSAKTVALAEAAAWIAEVIGYPVEARMPEHPMPQALWDALVDHIHADETTKWHGRELTRDETESWLADEAGR